LEEKNRTTGRFENINQLKTYEKSSEKRRGKNDPELPRTHECWPLNNNLIATWQRKLVSYSSRSSSCGSSFFSLQAVVVVNKDFPPTRAHETIRRVLSSFGESAHLINCRLVVRSR
jgi:hypothetical protein